MLAERVQAGPLADPGWGISIGGDGRRPSGEQPPPHLRHQVMVAGFEQVVVSASQTW